MSDDYIPRITRDQFNLWKSNPVTRTVFKFLEAYRDQCQREHLERWQQGELDEQLEMRALGVILFTDSFLQLNFDAIEAYLSSDPTHGTDDANSR